MTFNGNEVKGNQIEEITDELLQNKPCGKQSWGKWNDALKTL